jgi:hypothetical protein
MLSAVRNLCFVSSENNIFIKLSSFFIAILLLVSGLCGCADGSRKSAYEIVTVMTDAMGASLPAGALYVLPVDAASGTPESADASVPNARWHIANDSLLSAAFGKGDNDEISELSQEIVDSGAFFLSTAAEPCEYVVLRCVSRSDTDLVAGLLLYRLDALRRQYRGTDQQTIVENASIVILGKYVVLAVSNNAEKALEAAKDTVKQS